MDNVVVFNNIKYEIIKDKHNLFSKDDVTELFTDYFNSFDYVLGDISYDKLRLKGFCNKKNKFYKTYNDYEKIDAYIKERYLNTEKYFILKKIDK